MIFPGHTMFHSTTILKGVVLSLVLTLANTGKTQKVDLETYCFYGPRPYAEVWLRIDRNSVEWQKTEDGMNRSSVNVLLTIVRQDSSIAAADKFVLQAAASDSLTDFLAVRRFALSAGNYTMSVEIEDAILKAGKVQILQKFQLDGQSQWQLSDPLLLAKILQDSTFSPMAKNGLLMEPLAFGYAGEEIRTMPVYVESYVMDKPDSTVVYLQCRGFEGAEAKPGEKALFTLYQKCKGNAEEAQIVQVPLQVLRSGTYRLVFSLIDKSKNVLATRQSVFVRMNPAADVEWLAAYNADVANSFVEKLPADQMDYILKAHLPITEQHQVSTLGELLKSNRLASQRQFIFQLWKSRAPVAPEEAFQKYMEVVRAVDQKFHTNVGYGFQSDRGHIFLKYGLPTNVITVDTEVDAPPYEIWYYHRMPQTRQTNVRFLFYNPTLVHNNFQLLHSTCLGEKINPAWEIELYKSVPMDRLGPTIDATQVKEGTNRNARRYFNEF